MIMGSTVKYKIGDKVTTSGPGGAIMGILPGIIIREATYKEWIEQIPPPNSFGLDYSKCYFYEVSVD